MMIGKEMVLTSTSFWPNEEYSSLSSPFANVWRAGECLLVAFKGASPENAALIQTLEVNTKIVCKLRIVNMSSALLY